MTSPWSWRPWPVQGGGPPEPAADKQRPPTSTRPSVQHEKTPRMTRKGSVNQLKFQGGFVLVVLYNGCHIRPALIWAGLRLRARRCWTHHLNKICMWWQTVLCLSDTFMNVFDHLCLNSIPTYCCYNERIWCRHRNITNARFNIKTYIYIHTYIHTYVYIYKYIYIYTYIYKHVCSLYVIIFIFIDEWNCGFIFIWKQPTGICGIWYHLHYHAFIPDWNPFLLHHGVLRVCICRLI